MKKEGVKKEGVQDVAKLVDGGRESNPIEGLGLRSALEKCLCMLSGVKVLCCVFDLSCVVCIRLGIMGLRSGHNAYGL